MPLKIIEHNSKEYQQMLGLRMEILRKPLGLSFDEADIEKEKDDVCIGAFEDGKILGCCLLTKLDDRSMRLRQMAVTNNSQRNGVGRVMMDFAENIARDLGYKTMVMHARKTAIGFYQKQGYTISGEEFEEVTLPHFLMFKNL
ncbi:MAG: GNAT family N-acetyltransferase [Bacteroidetes bacterium]|nr:GNAT family N-acetyltransferase [Bacteroidota bacterium]